MRGPLAAVRIQRVGRYRFVILWVTLLMVLAVLAAVVVSGASGTTRSVLAFEPLHIVAHLFLYGVLAAGISDLGPRGVALPFAAFVSIAIVQEGLQSLAIRHAPTRDSAFDVAVDLVGGALGVLAFARFRKRLRARKGSLGP